MARKLYTADTQVYFSLRDLLGLGSMVGAKLLAGEDALLVTDSLAMGAITEQYGPGEAAVQAFLAGNDLLLMPAGLEEAFEAVLGAVQDGTIPEERLEESVARILRFKEYYAGLSAAA